MSTRFFYTAANSTAAKDKVKEKVSIKKADNDKEGQISKVKADENKLGMLRSNEALFKSNISVSQVLFNDLYNTTIQ